MIAPTPAPRPLEGITVIDLTIALAGPYATQLLGALGATVIKVENPAGGDPARNNAPYLGDEGFRLARTGPKDMSISMLERGRNKLSVTLDLKLPEGREVFADLVRNADVVVENFSGGTTDRMGIGFAWAAELNPTLVYTSISGFGAGEPGKGMDTIFQAMSGLMTTAGTAGDDPVRNGVPFGDLVGPLFAVIGTVSALFMRERCGRGQHVDVSLLGALTSLVATEPWDTMERAGIEMRTGNVVPRLAPFGIFETTDGHVALCAPTDAFAAGVFAAIGRSELAGDDRFSSRDRRVGNATVLHALVAEWAAGLSTAEAAEQLLAQGVPAAAVRPTAEAVRDPRSLARGETVQLAHPELGLVDDLYGSGFPVRFSAAESGYATPPPWLGEHNDFILGGMLGYSRERIDALREAGAL
jgi:crotonobetainyl-CoA:carnitine CoA-transferase CaiB-like acyl-CoA transferase